MADHTSMYERKNKARPGGTGFLFDWKDQRLVT
jgi:hypothetical protein